MNLKTIGSRLRSARISADLIQSEVALKTKVSTTAVSRYERGEGGEPTLNFLVNFSKLCNVSVDWILGVKQERMVNVAMAASIEYIEKEKSLIC